MSSRNEKRKATTTPRKENVIMMTDDFDVGVADAASRSSCSTVLPCQARNQSNSSKDGKPEEKAGEREKWAIRGCYLKITIVWKASLFWLGLL